MTRPLIYFDNAATSWPKPETTYAAMDGYSRFVGGSPGRSGHRLSIDAGHIILETRERVALLFGAADPFQIVFTRNATEALNIALFGLLSPGDHVITTSLEHNSVMRPLRALEGRGVSLSVSPCSPRGELDPEDMRRAIRPETRAVVMTHASNVAGTVLPLEEIGRITGENGLILIVDAAQTAGAIPIDVGRMGIDLLAFTGHKSLFGPQGTGGLYIRKGLENRIAPLLRGGTGSRSEFEEQPDFMPDKFESGTPNTPGLAGLGAGVAFLLEQGVDRIRDKERELTRRFMEGLLSIDGVALYGPPDDGLKIPVVSFNVGKIPVSEAALFFDEEYGILCRPGLHCAPAAHRTIGTFPAGTVRFSFGFFNTVDQIEQALAAIRDLIRRRG